MLAPALVLALLLPLQSARPVEGSFAQPLVRQGVNTPEPFGGTTAGTGLPAASSDALGRLSALASPQFQSDARLRDVCFASPTQGWAVGDRGVIWHTDDGGNNWRPQSSGVDCSLASVCFVDELTGWAAGGATQPYLHTGVGVLLATRDGGRTWRSNSRLTLPMLRKVRFFNARNGVAIGCPSALFPSGVLTTDNGGVSWNPMPGVGAADWLAGDFIDTNTGALAGRRGVNTPVRRRSYQRSDENGGLRSIGRMQFDPVTAGWMVGDGGLVMRSDNVGDNWRTVPALSGEIASQFDFRALSVRGAHVWIAGSPGTRVLHSPDDGRTWQSFATGNTAPLEAICFVDERRGWAVGALGVILATEDGGRTWRRQRAGAVRAAVLALVADVGDAPLELIARLSANDGYLAAVEVLGRRDVELAPESEVHPGDRLQEAVCAVGGSESAVAWRFPLRQKGLTMSAESIVELWNRTNDGRGLIEFEAGACRAIRQWRPEIIVTHDASPRGDDPLGHLINQTVLQAVRDAADPSRFPEQIAQAGLEPWQVKKVFAALPPGARGSIDLPTAQLASRLGRSLADLAGTPRGLLGEPFQTVPPLLAFRLLLSNLAQDQAQRDFFTGLLLPRGGDARRALGDLPSENLETVRRMAEKRRNIQALLERLASNPQGGTLLLDQAGELTHGLDPDGAARVLYQLGQSYHHSGRLELAADTFAMLGERHRDHPLARAASIWLVQYYAGSEPAWRVSGVRRQGVVQASALVVSPVHFEKRGEQAAALGREIERLYPQLYADPAVRFPLAVAQRNLATGQQAGRFHALQGRSAENDAWKRCAAGEAWLVEPKGPPPKPILNCALASAKPKLDGVLDDAVWRRAKPAAMRSELGDDEQWPAAVMLAHDDEYLYIGVKCRKGPRTKYDSTPGPRPRDPDLSRQDRVEILLDLDRDYATYYRLVIDHRGWVAEDCWGDRTWDPQWYAAATQDDEVWSAEAAIPWSELTGKPPTSRAVWAVGAQRILPATGFQSWSTPASVAGMPQGFGYLLFE